MTKFNLKTKFIALTAMLVVLTLGIIVINVFIAVKKSNFEKEVQELNSALRSVLSITGDISEVKQEYEKLLMNLSQTSEKFESEMDYLNYIRKIKNNAAWYAVELTELEPHMEDTMPPFREHLTITKEGLQRYEIELSFKGSFRSIGRLLEMIAKENKKIYVKTISINRADLAEPGFVEANIVAYSYGLNTL